MPAASEAGDTDRSTALYVRNQKIRRRHAASPPSLVILPRKKLTGGRADGRPSIFAVNARVAKQAGHRDANHILASGQKPDRSSRKVEKAVQRTRHLLNAVATTL